MRRFLDFYIPFVLLYCTDPLTASPSFLQRTHSFPHTRTPAHPRTRTSILTGYTLTIKKNVGLAAC